MTVFNKIRILILTLLFGVLMVTCANEKKDCCIIFWETEPGLSMEYLDKTDYLECIKRFPDYVKIDFSEIERFDSDCQVFVLKKEIDKYRYQRIAKDGQFYVSIVVDNKIVLNGINGFVIATISPSGDLPEIDDFKYLIDTCSKKYLIISDSLIWEDFIKRDSMDPDVKKLISKKIK